MNTVFLLMAQFGSVTLTMEQVRQLLGGLAVQTIRNRVSAGKFPRPTSDGVWLVQDVADYLDRSKSAPHAKKAA
jgi:predicted DNA-binding transcriptional regulator AlpA